jgi:hypothetical protein
VPELLVLNSCTFGTLVVLHYATWYQLVLPSSGALLVLLFEGLSMGRFVPFLHQTSTGVCPIQLEDSSAAAARKILSNRVTHNLFWTSFVNSINKVPIFIACNQMGLPQLVDCLFWRLFVVPS